VSRTLFRSLFSFDPRPAPEVDADIRAELDSHLAMIEDELLAQGATPADARAQALARFGDPARLARQARTIKLGDRIMLQRINLALLIVLGSAVIFLLVQNQRINSRSIQTLEQVSASLTALQQRQPAPQAAPTPPGPPSKVVYIEGAVERPGTFMIPPGGFTLKRLIAAAGGLKDSAKTVYLDHQAEDAQDSIFSTSNFEAWNDPSLKADDVVTVSDRPDPRAPHMIQVSVRGYVHTPSTRWIGLEHATVANLLAGSNAPMHEATHVRIERAAGGPADTLTIAEALADKGRGTRLAAGDVIHVLSPEKEADAPAGWQTYTRTPRVMELARFSTELMHAVQQREQMDSEYEDLLKNGYPRGHDRIIAVRGTAAHLETQIVRYQFALLKDELEKRAAEDQKLRDLLAQRAVLEANAPTRSKSQPGPPGEFIEHQKQLTDLDRQILARYEELTK
jgi:hypothetical protein